MTTIFFPPMLKKQDDYHKTAVDQKQPKHLKSFKTA